MAFLEVHGVSKSFVQQGRPVSVLHRLHFGVEEGEFVCVIGYSGSGKTTLLSLLAGLLLPDSGEIRLEGTLVDGPHPDRGLVFQNYSLLPWMTVYENVALAVDAVARQDSPAQRHARTEHYIRLVKLGDAMQKRPAELSGGMRQRVAVARGLALESRVLLLDEPFRALDALTRATLQDELSRIWVENRRTMVMVTNDVEEAILLADRIFPLTPGPGATLGPEISVPIPRPRVSRQLSLDPQYQRVRQDITDFLVAQHQASKRSFSHPVVAEVW
ncbi:MAG: ABC transporter ATP-binding protein [Candidatus Binatia bacterium]